MASSPPDPHEVEISLGSVRVAPSPSDSSMPPCDGAAGTLTT